MPVIAFDRTREANVAYRELEAFLDDFRACAAL